MSAGLVRRVLRIPSPTVSLLHAERMADLSKENLPVGLKKTMAEWQFSSSSVNEFGLPIDPVLETFIRPDVRGAIFSRCCPTPIVKNVRLVAFSKDVLINILDMHPCISNTEEFVQWIAGKNVLNSSTPLAHRYGGHQFGTWAMQLGDGRAMSLGEYVSRDGKRWDIQLKGSGLTPYSRGGDGRAVLRSSVREFLCSEAMHALGIPTSRAAALVVSSDEVIRDQFYQGDPQLERAAIVMRIAPSWLRFGSLEILSHNRELVELRKLLDYAISLRPDISDSSTEKYFLLLERVFNESIEVVVAWQSVGFTHGVLNTDNMSLFGITIDYGPFGFVESYDPDFIPNTSDSEGRYAYSNQIKVLHWNLEKLALAALPLLSNQERLKVKAMLDQVIGVAQAQYMNVLNEKLGFESPLNPNVHLCTLLLKMMEETGSDFTMTFRQLGLISIDEFSNQEAVEKHWSLKRLSKHDKFLEFVDMYQQHMKEEGLTDEKRRKYILKKNPQYVLRNWMAQQAIEKAEKDDFSDVSFLLEVLQHPYTVNEEAEKRGYSGPTPQWSSSIRVSCSS